MSAVNDRIYQENKKRAHMDWKDWRESIEGQLKSLRTRSTVCVECGSVFVFKPQDGDYAYVTSFATAPYQYHHITLSSQGEYAKHRCPQHRPAARKRYKAKSHAKG